MDALDERLGIRNIVHASVHVTVLRDLPPLFTNLPQARTADEADTAGTMILQLKGFDGNLRVSILL